MPERPSMGTLIVAGIAISKGKGAFQMRGKSDIFCTTFTFGQSAKSPFQRAYSTDAHSEARIGTHAPSSSSTRREKCVADQYQRYFAAP
jgi:hypothetical protein